MKATIVFFCALLCATVCLAGDFGSGGVKEARDGGYKSSQGYAIYKIKCNNGGSGSAFQKPDGYWYDGTGHNYGDRYRNSSLSELAQEMCK